MQINPFKGAVLLNQVLNIPELLFIHPGVGNKQDAPVDIPRVLEGSSDVPLRHLEEAPHLHPSHNHPALFQMKDRVQQQRIAENLNLFGNPPGLTHPMGAVDNKGGGNKVLHLLD